MNDEYLGAGVYASFDGDLVFLDLRTPDTGRIALEPEVLNALIRYSRKFYGNSIGIPQPSLLMKGVPE